MFLAEFMLGTLAFIFREHLARSLKEELLFGIERHYNLTREPGTLPAVWDHIHTEVITMYNETLYLTVKNSSSINIKQSFVSVPLLWCSRLYRLVSDRCVANGRSSTRFLLYTTRKVLW